MNILSILSIVLVTSFSSDRDIRQEKEPFLYCINSSEYAVGTEDLFSGFAHIDDTDHLLNPSWEAPYICFPEKPEECHIKALDLTRDFDSDNLDIVLSCQELDGANEAVMMDEDAAVSVYKIGTEVFVGGSFSLMLITLGCYLMCTSRKGIYFRSRLGYDITMETFGQIDEEFAKCHQILVPTIRASLLQHNFYEDIIDLIITFIEGNDALYIDFCSNYQISRWSKGRLYAKVGWHFLTSRESRRMYFL